MISCIAVMTCVALQELVHTAASCALHVGSASQVTVPKDDPLLSAVVKAIVSRTKICTISYVLSVQYKCCIALYLGSPC